MTIMNHPRKITVVDVSCTHVGYLFEMATDLSVLTKREVWMTSQAPFVALAKKLVPGLFNDKVPAITREEILARWLHQKFESVPIVNLEENTWSYAGSTDILWWPLRDGDDSALRVKSLILSFLYKPCERHRMKHVFQPVKIWSTSYPYSVGTKMHHHFLSSGFGPLQKYARAVASIHEEDLERDASGKTYAVECNWFRDGAYMTNVAGSLVFRHKIRTKSVPFLYRRDAVQAFNNRFGCVAQRDETCPFRVVLPFEVDEKTLVVDGGGLDYNFELQDLNDCAKEMVENMLNVRTVFPPGEQDDFLGEPPRHSMLLDADAPAAQTQKFFLVFQPGAPYDWDTCRKTLHQQGLPVAIADRLPASFKDKLMNLGHPVEVQVGTQWRLSFFGGRFSIGPAPYHGSVFLEPKDPNQQPKRRRPGSGGWSRKRVAHRAAEEEISPAYFAPMTAPKPKGKGTVKAPKYITRADYPVNGLEGDDPQPLWTGRVRRSGRTWEYETKAGEDISFLFERQLKLVRNGSNVRPSVGGHVVKVAESTSLDNLFN